MSVCRTKVQRALEVYAVSGLSFLESETSGRLLVDRHILDAGRMEPFTGRKNEPVFPVNAGRFYADFGSGKRKTANFAVIAREDHRRNRIGRRMEAFGHKRVKAMRMFGKSGLNLPVKDCFMDCGDDRV